MAATPETEVVAGIRSDYKYGFHTPEDYFFKSGRGLSPEIVAEGGPELAEQLEAEGYDPFIPAGVGGESS